MIRYLRSSYRNDKFLFVTSMGLILLGIAICVYDLYSVTFGTVDMNKHMPFLVGLSVIAMGCMAIYTINDDIANGCKPVSRRLPEGEIDEVGQPIYEAVPTDSYQHPDNHPRGRIDAPDGLSD